MTAPADPLWWNAGLAVLHKASRLRRPFTIYEISRRYGLPEPPHHSCWGRLAVRGIELGLLRRHDAANGARPTVRGSLVRTYVGGRG